MASGKVDSMIRELDYEKRVNIAGYDSSTNYYETPSAGMAIVYCSLYNPGSCVLFDLETTTGIYGDAHQIFAGSFPHGYGATFYVPVKKGAKLYQLSSKSAQVIFIPYK